LFFTGKLFFTISNDATAGLTAAAASNAAAIALQHDLF
tara:strand:+ start:60 stop:173 length:114 start_codon:yes stop_codon:yes gene_type:complete